MRQGVWGQPPNLLTSWRRQWTGVVKNACGNNTVKQWLLCVIKNWLKRPCFNATLRLIHWAILVIKLFTFRVVSRHYIFSNYIITPIAVQLISDSHRKPVLPLLKYMSRLIYSPTFSVNGRCVFSEPKDETKHCIYIGCKKNERPCGNTCYSPLTKVCDVELGPFGTRIDDQSSCFHSTLSHARQRVYS